MPLSAHFELIYLFRNIFFLAQIIAVTQQFYLFIFNCSGFFLLRWHTLKCKPGQTKTDYRGELEVRIQGRARGKVKDTGENLR